MIIKGREGIFPVEFKHTTQKPHKNHIYQLVAYALLLEEKYKVIVDKGFVYLIPAADVQVFDLTRELKNEVLDILASIRTMIRNERMPEQTRYRSRCADCEYRNFCGDVF